MLKRDFLRWTAALALTPTMQAIGGPSAAGVPDRPQPRRAVVTPADQVTDLGAGRLCAVFSHGFMMDRTMFAPQLEALSPRYRTVAYDSRARTSAWEGPYDLYDLAEDCRAVLDRLHVDRTVVVGMSMGGWMAVRLALRYPERVAGLVLIDSPVSVGATGPTREFNETFEPLRGQKRLPTPYVDWVTREMFGDTTLRDNKELVAQWRERFLGYRGDAVYYEARAWRDRDDLSSAISAIKVPVLILHGDEDRRAPVSVVKPMVDALPAGELVVVPHAGHTSNLENAPFVNEAIGRFLGKLTAHT